MIKRLTGRCLQTGVSVGCGLAHKELRLLELGIVEKFILFELSEDAVRIGIERAREANMLDRVEFRIENAFDYDFTNQKIDLVYWNNALHHMLDVPAAVKWSYDILASNGVFCMDDYVGASRFQHLQSVLDIVNEIRDSLPRKYLVNPYNEGEYVGQFTNPNLDDLKTQDPSEAADSEKILASVIQYFPQAEVIPTGGIVYFLALGGIWYNFNKDDEEDLRLLDQLMLKDKMYAKYPNMSPYAVALAIK